ncbi:MAG TPA: zf-HC2 domain-containing protein [Segeticoccus sp.]|nr:zf-HC2 domain-containing protein [Segeticoccus sp.]
MPALPGGDGNHLGDLLSAYADRSLPANLQLTADRHVAVCERCRQDASAEVRLLSALRGDAVPHMSAGLAASLVGLGHEERPEPVAGREPVATVALGAPPMHRSVRHAVAVAAVAASVCGMAAWAFSGPSPVPEPGQPRLAREVAHRTGDQRPPAPPAPWQTTVVPVTAVLVDQRGGIGPVPPGRAESTP